MHCGLRRGALAFLIMSTLYGVPLWPDQCDSVRERVCRFRKKSTPSPSNHQIAFYPSLQTTQHSPSSCGYVRQILDTLLQVFHSLSTGHHLFGRNQVFIPRSKELIYLLGLPPFRHPSWLERACLDLGYSLLFWLVLLLTY